MSHMFILYFPSKIGSLWYLHLFFNVPMFERLTLLMLWILVLLYTIICFSLVCCRHLNMLVAGKRKCNHKRLRGKCQALKIWKIKCSIISCHEKELTFTKMLSAKNVLSIRWLVTKESSLEGRKPRKPHNFRNWIRGIKICYTRNRWWVVGNVSSNSFIKQRA